jgi:hypothetical protein
VRHAQLVASEGHPASAQHVVPGNVVGSQETDAEVSAADGP